jgi:DNA polymerase-1
VPLKYDLGALARRRAKFEVDKDDPWRLRYGELADVPLDLWPPDARLYAERDAVATLLVYEGQEALVGQLKEGPWLFVDQTPQVRAAWWLHQTSVHGIATSADAVDRLRVAAEQEIGFLEGVLTENGLVVDGHRKMKAVQDAVREAYELAGLPVRMTDGGKKGIPAVCTDRDACLESGDQLLEAYVDYSSAKKTLSTECKAYSVPIVHTRFESLAATGRTTSSGPNIQNVRWNFRDLCSSCGSSHSAAGVCLRCGGPAITPPGVRECFVPRPGMIFASADYDGLELRTLAQVCLRLLGHSRLAEVLNAGQDPHLMVASQILGRPYESLDKHDPTTKLARQTGKVANFGFPGGLGVKKFVLFARMSYKVRLTELDARRLKEQWLATFPEFREYFEYVNGLRQDDGTYAVDHLFSGRLRTGVPFTVACNSFFQGLGADATKAAGYLISRACYYDRISPLYGCRIVNYIHDEFILEVPDDAPEYVRADAAARELSRLMVLGAAPFLPDVPATAPPQLMVRWEKKAEAVFGPNGLLMPYGR